MIFECAATIRVSRHSPAQTTCAANDAISSDLATKLQLAGFDTTRSGVSKIEARLSYVDDKTLLYLAEVLKVQVQDLFPPRTPGNRIHEFTEKLETTRF